MMVDILGLLGAVGLVLFYLPQLWTLHRTPRVEGFNIYAWCASLMACLALGTGAGRLGWWFGCVANAVAAVAVAASMVLMRRKS